MTLDSIQFDSKNTYTVALQHHHHHRGRDRLSYSTETKRKNRQALENIASINHSLTGNQLAGRKGKDERTLSSRYGSMCRCLEISTLYACTERNREPTQKRQRRPQVSCGIYHRLSLRQSSSGNSVFKLGSREESSNRIGDGTGTDQEKREDQDRTV